MPTLSSTALDLKFALRQLKRAPGFTVTAVLTLALSMSAACIMFSLVRSVLLQPLSFPQANRLVGIGLDQPGNAPIAKQTGQTAQFILDHACSFASLGTLSRSSREMNFSLGNGHPSAVRVLQIGAGYLPTLQITPLLGRNFTASEDARGAGAVALLSERLWRGSLNSDPGVIGRVVRINGDPTTVVGVLPESFATVESPDLWTPLRMSPADPGWTGTNYDLFARLRAGVTLEQANAELKLLGAEILQTIPALRSWDKAGPPVSETAWPLQAVFAADAKPGLVALSCAVLAVWLIACLNLAALMTARSATRSPELAVRSALGAERSSLVRLLLGESLLLAMGGSVLGLAGAYVALPLLLHHAPLQIPAVSLPGVDLLTASFAVGAAILSTLLSGLLPALTSLRRNRTGSLGASRVSTGSAARQRLGRSLLIAQVSLTTALLAIAFGLLGTFVKLHNAAPGLRPAQLQVLQVQLEGQRYTSSARTTHFIQAALQRFSTLPGVTSVAASYGLPLDRNLNSSAGPENDRALVRYAEWIFVTPGYFSTVGTPILLGDDVPNSAAQYTEPVALVNEFAAQRWFGAPQNALDRLIVDGGGSKMRVAGVVAPVHLTSLADAQVPTLYLPIGQIDDKTAAMLNGWYPVTFALRLSGGNDTANSLPHAASAVITSLDPDIAISKFLPMQTFVDASYSAPRFYSWLATAFAGFSLLLAAVGLFGLLSYQVSSRTREIGVRMAVGARRGQVARLVLQHGLLLTGTGLLIGMLLAVALAPFVLHFTADALQVSPQEATSVLNSRLLTGALTSLVMLIAATAACVLPAQQAARVQPIEALRAD